MAFFVTPTRRTVNYYDISICFIKLAVQVLEASGKIGNGFIMW